MALTFSNPYSQGAYTALNVISSVSYTVPSGVDYLYIFIYVDAANTTAPTPDLVEFNSVSATLVSSIPTDAGGTGQIHFVYRIANPGAATANLRARHPTIQFGVGAVCLSCDGTLTVTTGSFNYANSISPSCTVSSASGDEALYSITVNNVDGTSVLETGGQTVLSEGGTVSNAMHQISRETSSGSSNSASWTVTGAQRWSAIAINFHETSQTVTSINGGSAIEAGEAGVAAITTGFTGLPLSITTNQSGITCSNISGSTNAPIFDVSGWVENAAYPKLPVSTLFTFTRNTESANASQDVIVPTGTVTQTFAGAITDDDTYITTEITNLGHVAEGADFYYVPYDDLFIFPDGKIQVTNDGYFEGWLRPISGSTAGKMYFLQVVIIDGSATISGLSVSELTTSGLSVPGLSVGGL